MLLRLLAASLALVSVPAVPETTVVTTPVDTIARAKFPNEPGQLIDAFALVNSVVNQSITYETDHEHYGVDELWVMYPKDGKGDCEDYALSKMGILSQMGFPIVTDAKIVGVMVMVKGQEYGHAILAVRLPKGEVAYLDSNEDHLMTRAELVAHHYRFSDWRA